MTVMLNNLAASRSPVRVGWRTNEPCSWTFDLDALAAAARELGIERPIVVGAIRGRGGHRKSGQHHVGADGHRITVLSRLPADAASRTLWHELRHAEQAERFPSTRAWDIAYEQAGGHRGTGYVYNAFEREAIACEHDHADQALVR